MGPTFVLLVGFVVNFNSENLLCLAVKEIA